MSTSIEAANAQEVSASSDTVLEIFQGLRGKAAELISIRESYEDRKNTMLIQVR